ncbi:MAG: hypothetical protein WD750_12930 [Gammaproteobacteria bacterium]
MTNTVTPTTTNETELPESQIAALLEYRFGDGLVYLPKNRSRALYSQARQHGFIDEEGYLTRKGRALIARYHYM